MLFRLEIINIYISKYITIKRVNLFLVLQIRFNLEYIRVVLIVYLLHLFYHRYVHEFCLKCFVRLSNIQQIL